MQKFLVLLAIVILLPGCDSECFSSATCIAPPDGTFQSEAINIAVNQSVLEEFEPNSYQSVGLLDSLVVHATQNDVTIVDFYEWVAIPEGSSITSVDIYYSEKSENIETEAFLFQSTESAFATGGYVLTVIKTSEETRLQIVRADQSWIDGVCNDVIDC